MKPSGTTKRFHPASMADNLPGHLYLGGQEVGCGAHALRGGGGYSHWGHCWEVGQHEGWEDHGSMR